MATKTINVTFTRTTVAEASITIPEGFDPASDTLEDVALDWLEGHADELNFSHDGCDIEVWNIEKATAADGAETTGVAAKVTLQRWVRDYPEDVETVRFDCRRALDAFPLDELPEQAEGFRKDGACDYGDDVFYEATRLGLVDDWGGPFEFDVTDEDAYAAYRAERAAKEAATE